mmetsp:Transcript_29215/g.67259  ORF Transcript_29215/g.67259 Transcript_29215/m.67259 type:complete len:273 (-) Transcript_29215:87-905(-)
MRFNALLVILTTVTAAVAFNEACEDSVCESTVPAESLLQSKATLGEQTHASESAVTLKFWEATHSRVRAVGAELLQHMLGQPTEAPADPLVVALVRTTEIMGVVSTALFWALVSLITAIAYRDQKKWPTKQQAAGNPTTAEMKEWSDGIFNCFGNLEICLCSWCCCPIRFADNVSHIEGLYPFWPTFSLMLALASLSYFVPAWILMYVIGAYIRQKIRAKFGMANGTCMSVTCDCCLYTWCWVCAVSQESRHLEAASLVGHPAIVHPDKASS